MIGFFQVDFCLKVLTSADCLLVRLLLNSGRLLIHPRDRIRKWRGFFLLTDGGGGGGGVDVGERSLTHEEHEIFVLTLGYRITTEVTFRTAFSHVPRLRTSVTVKTVYWRSTPPPPPQVFLLSP